MAHVVVVQLGRTHSLVPVGAEAVRALVSRQRRLISHRRSRAPTPRSRLHRRRMELRQPQRARSGVQQRLHFLESNSITEVSASALSLATIALRVYGRSTDNLKTALAKQVPTSRIFILSCQHSARISRRRSLERCHCSVGGVMSAAPRRSHADLKFDLNHSRTTQDHSWSAQAGQFVRNDGGAPLPDPAVTDSPRGPWPLNAPDDRPAGRTFPAEHRRARHDTGQPGQPSDPPRSWSGRRNTSSRRGGPAPSRRCTSLRRRIP